MTFNHGVGSTDHFLKFLYYTSFLTPCALPSVQLFSILEHPNFQRKK